ncbi:hypothetical protein FF38_10752 [Lucilia cuprina]|uniref:Uncharacterized protein n=1 Tax=Lucilia cuprina TaxID=7375 RepID=A0A0L0CK45_LUCCU|nr:hypothetical protein FF38_10752 [Lucilia cuprina]
METEVATEVHNRPKMTVYLIYQNKLIFNNQEKKQSLESTRRMLALCEEERPPNYENKILSSFIDQIHN